MANEVEPLKKLQNLIRSVAWQPDFLLKIRVVESLLQEEEESFKNECADCKDSEMDSKGPFLLHGSTRKIGVVLMHSYLSVPEEVLELAHYLNSKGAWVYAPRLAGHGTTPENQTILNVLEDIAEHIGEKRWRLKKPGQLTLSFN